MGFCSGTDLSPDGLDDLARRAVALARHSTPDEANGAPDARQRRAASAAGDSTLFDPAALELSVERKIDMALELERVALGADPRIRRTDGASGEQQRRRVRDRQHARRRARLGGQQRERVGRRARGGRDGRQQTGVYGMSQRHLADLAPMEAIGARGRAPRGGAPRRPRGADVRACPW